MPLPILFAIIGAITGLLVSQVAINFKHADSFFYLFTQVLVVAVFAFIWKKQPTRLVIKSMLFMALLLFGLAYWFISQGYPKSHFSPFFIVALIQISVICTAFIQSWKPDKPHFTYTDLFENAWNNHFFLIFSALLTGGFLLVLGLGTSLFDSIGFKQVSNVIWSKEITPVIVATLIGTGIGISREYDSLIFKIRGVFFAIFRVMAYLTAAIVILFTLSLPFSVGNLFNNRNTSLILLSIVAISILLLNTLVDAVKSGKKNDQLTLEKKQEASADQVLAPWRNRIFSLQIILLPFLSVLSVYAIILRINQYGFMPKRLIALAVAVLLSIYSVVYLYQLLKQKGKWTLGLASVNPPLAILWVTMLVVMASPLLDPIRLSVSNQVSRLQNEQVNIEKFDFHALKYRLGKQGKEALNTLIETGTHPKHVELKQVVDNLLEYPRDKQAFLELIGEPPSALATLKSRYSHERCNPKSPCYVKQMDLKGDGTKQVMVFVFDENKLSAELLEYDEKWKILKTYGYDRFNRPPFRPSDIASLSYKEKESIIEVLKINEEKIIKPKFMDLDLGVIKLRQ